MDSKAWVLSSKAWIPDSEAWTWVVTSENSVLKSEPQLVRSEVHGRVLYGTRDILQFYKRSLESILEWHEEHSSLFETRSCWFWFALNGCNQDANVRERFLTSPNCFTWIGTLWHWIHGILTDHLRTICSTWTLGLGENHKSKAEGIRLDTLLWCLCRQRPMHLRIAIIVVMGWYSTQRLLQVSLCALCKLCWVVQSLYFYEWLRFVSALARVNAVSQKLLE